jgi:hypothetical protein
MSKNYSSGNCAIRTINCGCGWTFSQNVSPNNSGRQTVTIQERLHRKICKATNVNSNVLEMAKKTSNEADIKLGNIAAGKKSQNTVCISAEGI